MVARAITVVQMLPELESGGVERGTLELGRYLCRNGNRSIVISAGGRLVEKLLQEGSEHIAWKVGKKTPICLKYILPLRRLLVQEKVDILHLRSRLPAWIGYLAWKSLPQALRPKLVTTFHGIYSINKYSAIMTKGQRVIAISKIVSDHIQEHYGVPSDRIQIIHRGVDEDRFRPEHVEPQRVERLKKLWGLGNAEGPIIMLPGRVTEWKGHDIFIQSLSCLRHLPWTAVCVGDIGEKQTYLQSLMHQIAKVGLEDRIRFVGHCEDMPAAFMLSDIAVSASSTEPEAFGRVAIEAQAMGVPVVATAHGGSLETVLSGKTGWLVPPCDPNKMAEALMEAITQPSVREGFGSNGRRWANAHFTTRNMCEETLRVYETLIS